MTESIEFSISGMHCASCGLLIDETVEDLDGVVRCTTDNRRRRTTVSFDPATVDPSIIAAAISDVGYEASLADPR